MNYREMETKMEKIVTEFVKTQEGRYTEHISDKCLVGLLMHELSRPYLPVSSVVTRLEMAFTEDSSALYEAAVPVFEGLLEHTCGVICNGHHVAQNFSRFVQSKLEEV